MRTTGRRCRSGFLYASHVNPICKPISREMRTKRSPLEKHFRVRIRSVQASVGIPLSIWPTNKIAPHCCEAFGAENETRTRDPDLGNREKWPWSALYGRFLKLGKTKIEGLFHHLFYQIKG